MKQLTRNYDPYKRVHPDLVGKIGIRTQQGLSQHTLWLSGQDAQIYVDLLRRNKIWYADVTNYESQPELTPVV